MRKISLSTLAFMLLSAGIGALAALLLRGDETPAPAPVVRDSPKPETAPAPISDVPGAVERALRRRIQQLESELAAARNPPTNAVARPEIHPMPPPGEARRLSPREMMENFKKNDPKRYHEFRQRVAQMRKRQLERTKDRLGYLGAIDTAGMSADEKANHERLQDLLVQRENLPEFSETMTDEEMREAGRQRRELDQAIREANAAERSALLRQTAAVLGLSGEDATVFAEAVQEVVHATESERGWLHGGPPGPPPGGAPR